MIRAFNIAALLLIGCVGLHLPRSFTLLYGFAGVIAALVFLTGQGSDLKTGGVHLSKRRSTLLLVLFAVSYGIGMVWWGFWRWPADALDLVNAMILPGLLFFVGSQAAALSRTWFTRILLSYSLGGVVYGLAALAVARQPWWNLSQIFPLTIHVAWGSLVEINVRSVEQTAFPALLLIAPALWLLGAPASAHHRRLGMMLLALGALGAHVVWSLNGRLGWLSLLLSIAPLGWVLGSKLFSRLSRSWLKLASIVFFAVIALLFGWYLLSPLAIQDSGSWSQRLCDERFSIFGSILMRLHQAPWGGRSLVVPFSLCGDHSSSLVLAAKGGVIAAVHNVILDIYFNVGWIPVVLLLAAIIPNLLAVFWGFWLAWPRWDWQVVLRWSWVCFLAFQWLFQPLLYSDGLLYYFSFFVLGLLSVQAVDGYLQRDGSNREVRLPQPQSTL